MTAGAGIKVGDAGEAAVFAKIVAALAAFVYLGHMELVVKIDGLLFLGVKQLWEDKPTAQKAADKTNDKKEQNNPAGAVFALFWGITCLRGCRVGNRMLLIVGVHEYSVILR